jgi:nitroreductase
MDAYEAIITRRSIRKYTSRDIEYTLVTKILQAGMMAPSAHNRCPWQFIVITEKEKLLAIPRFHPYSEMLKHAPMAVLIAGDKRIQKSEEYLVQDCAAATENMLLAAHALGLGAVWLAVYPRQERMQGIIDLFAIPDYIFPVSMIALGYPAEVKMQPERFDPGRVHHNQW